MATGVVLRVGAPCCLGAPCASSSSSSSSSLQSRVLGSGAQVSTLKFDGSGMKFRDKLGLLRWEGTKVWTPVVGALPGRGDSFEEPSSASDLETDERAGEITPQSWDKQEISPEAGAMVLLSSQSSPSTSLQSLSKDAAMGIILRAAGSTAGWTTGSGLEGPAYSMKKAASDMPGPIFSKSPRRRMRVAFTCNVCGHRSIRAINPHAYTDGTVFVQCEGCDVFHKLVDNLKLFHELKGRIYRGYEAFEVGYDQYYDFLG